MKQLELCLLREKIIKVMRDFFVRQGFHEIITPVLNTSIPLEPNIYPFKTGKYFLSTSPEKNLKKMLAQGLGNCFSIGHSFRNLEATGPLHTAEFLMLEWYRKNADYTKIMKDVKALILFTNPKLANNWKTLSLIDLFKKYCHLDFKEIILSKKKLFEYAKKKGYQTKNTSWSELYDQIFVNEIEQQLPKEPCFLIDFPSRISPLCKPKKNEPYLAERFELYIQGIELANGNTENTNIESVKKGLRTPVDNEFLQSLEKMKDASYAGVGFGIDRLTMIFSHTSYIKFD